jgi:putative endonuclease
VSLSGPAADSSIVGRMTVARQTVGAWGERRAAQHLADDNFRVVGRNWRCPIGEIDIIAWDGDTLVFCEVKTRRGLGFGLPAEAVVAAKARRLRRLGARWLAANSVHPREIRFDVIAVLIRRPESVEIDHIRGAF